MAARTAAMYAATALAAGGAATICLCVQITICSACLGCPIQLATLAGRSSSALTQLNQAIACLPGLMDMKEAQEVCCIVLFVLQGLCSTGHDL